MLDKVKNIIIKTDLFLFKKFGSDKSVKLLENIKEAKIIFTHLNETGKENVARFVGGCVRKSLTGEIIDDVDLAITLEPNEVKKKLLERNIKVIDTGISHGTLTVIINNKKFELTTLRKDIKTDGWHAEVEYTDDWQEDSERRDFTINAIYLDINGKIFDPQLGTRDLKNCNIKFIGAPQKRIEEDYLRIIRFIRFSLEYESKIDESTIQAIKLNLDGIKKISKERILIELFKILQSKNFLKLNKKKSLKDIFLLIFPEFKNLERLSKLEAIMNKSNIDREILLAVLLIDETNNHEYFSHKYNVSNDLKESLNLMAKNFTQIQLNKKFFLKDLKKNVYFFGKQHLIALNILYFSNSKKVKLKDY